MAKKAKGRKKTFTLPLLILAGLAPGLYNMWAFRNGGVSAVVGQAGRIYLGYDVTGERNFGNLRYGTLPIVAGVLGHYLASKLGINRALGRAGVPVIRL